MRIFSNLLPRSAWQWTLSGIGLLALIVFSGFIIAETTKAEVAIVDNGEEQTIKTHADTVQELLEEAGITYSNHDDLSHNIDAEIEDGMTITYEEANKLTVVIDGDEEVYYTTADNISEFLEEQNISITEHDETSHSNTADITDKMVYSVDKAFEVTLFDAGKEIDIEPTTSGSVKQILKNNDIALDELDKVKPALNKTVNKGDEIRITRVEKSTEKVEEPIEYEIEKRKDNSLEKGKEQVIAEGQEGVLVKTVEITKENGEEVSRETIKKQVKQESEKRIVALGTKEKEQNLKTLSSESSNRKDDEAQNGNVLYMNASAYTTDCLGCNGSGNTATGINLKENPNVVSVDPNVIPLGSKVWVEGYGNAIAGDTGGHIKGNRIDLHFESKSAANSFGRKTVKVKVLE